MHANAEPLEHGVNNLHEFHLVEQRVGANHVGVALIELAVASFLRTVGAPHRLNLVAFERQLEFVAVHHHIACEGYGEVVAESFFAEPCLEIERVAAHEFLVADVFQVIA